MTCYLNDSTLDRDAVRVERFGLAHATAIRERVARKQSGRRALVRVTHASVGVTDAMAVRGDYLLQPVRGFVPGYDFVGVIERLPAGDRSGLHVGQRVAGILPRMGAHASLISVAPSLLVPVPDLLDSATAATIPLDAVTALFAIDALAMASGTILVQGAGGAVGAWAAQLAAARGLTAYGTASPRSHAYAERFTDSVYDYDDPTWIDQILDATTGGVDGAIDHTGSRSVRRAVGAGGRVVRTAFGGAPGQGRISTAAGFAASTLRRYARPGERVCSVPILVATQRARYRQALTELFTAVGNGTLVPPRPRIMPLVQYPDALASATRAAPGEKTILTTQET
ncbi:zinc-binding dehydrogenase [Microbacterium tenebrionis]|uniref:zinc-binding dehydrogenase n=1 Tax=Microbacterium tenebrionis TaxID=2830665 RepID=UPI00158F26EB|nr:zinc-binding dehydrogenase [Microbacterium ihumii]